MSICIAVCGHMYARERAHLQQYEEHPGAPGMYISIYLYIHVCVCVYMYVFMYTYMRVCVCVCVCACE